MKNLKILFLTFALLLPVLCSYADGNIPKCNVMIIVSDEETKIVKVDSGTVCEMYLSNLERPTAAGKVFIRWDVAGVNSDHVIFKDTTIIKAIWMSQEEANRIQDSITWERSFKSYTTKLVSDSIGAALSEQDQKGEFWLYVMLGLALLLSIISIVLLPKKYQIQDDNFREAVVKIVMESTRLKNWREEGKVAEKSTVIPSTSYDSDIRDLRKRVAELEDKLRNSTRENSNTVIASSSSSSQGKTKVTTSSEQYLYADSIVNDIFHKVKESPSEDSVFELKLKGGSKASVTIYKPAYGKVLANASFLEGCDKQVMGYTSVHIDREGTAEKDDNGKWKVVTPLKVVLK